VRRQTPHTAARWRPTFASSHRRSTTPRRCHVTTTRGHSHSPFTLNLASPGTWLPFFSSQAIAVEDNHVTYLPTYASEGAYAVEASLVILVSACVQTRVRICTYDLDDIEEQGGSALDTGEASSPALPAVSISTRDGDGRFGSRSPLASEVGAASSRPILRTE
jgi:hypothetical protein